MNEIILTPDFYKVIETGIQDRYRYESKQFVKWMKETEKGFELSTLEDWKKYLQKQSYRARTVNRKIMIAKMLFRFVISKMGNRLPHGQRESILNSLDGIKKLKELRAADVVSKVLSKEEIETFIEKCNEYNREISLIFQFLYHTGCRISEALNVKNEDCKFIGKSIYSITILGKGSKERTVYISQDFMGELREFFGGSGLLLQFKKRKRSRSYVSMFIKRYCKKFLDRHDISAHILRHSFCTHALTNGLSLEHVRIMAGHSDIQTTSRYYSHVVVTPEQFVNAT